MAVEFVGKLADLMSLGRRLLHASPARWADFIRKVEKMVEGEEITAEFDRELSKRAKRHDERFIS